MILSNMRKITVQLDPEILGTVINVARQEQAQLTAERDILEEKIVAKSRYLEDLQRIYEMHVPEGEIRRLPMVPTRTKEGRVKANQSEVLVKDYLKSRNGKGASLAEIAKGTGTTYKTVWRLIKRFEKSKEVERLPDKSWRWNESGSNGGD